ncbi:MAG TPA: M28 family metallopeptidase [Longimicrobiaceae bacterium]|nr:M28 family metallopeptidase [Longimicrobiaceae bacterium]
MKIYIDQAPESAPGRGPAPAGPGIARAQFGRETLFFQEDAAGAAPAGAERSARLAQREAAATREQLHVVVQNGRLFQQVHPEVPVLHDRGRFLLVQLDPERARRLAQEDETCFGVLPLAEEIVFEERAPVDDRAPAAFVQGLVGRLDRTRLADSLSRLVGFTTRHSISEEFLRAAAFAREQLSGIGYQVRTQDVPVNGRASLNVIAEKEGGAQGPRSVVIVTAHLDSVNLRDGPSAPAPGADDNARGSAGLLEIAHVFRDHRGSNDLRLILFGGEEQGLHGSKHYVASLSQAERGRILAVVNMDMIGSLNRASASVLLEGSSLSRTVIDGLHQAASSHTRLVVETALNPFASDHVPFIAAGIPAVLTIEGADNANERVHSAADTLEHVDPDFALEILRMNVAFVAGLVGDGSQTS